MPTPTRWERFWVSEWSAFLVSWTVGITLVIHSFRPSGFEFCSPPEKDGYRQCHSDHVYGVLFHEGMIFMDRHQGFLLALIAVAAAWVAHLQRRTMHEQHESNQRTERAYVYLNTSGTRAANAAQLVPHSPRPLYFANFGRTPAKIVGILASCKYWPNGVVENLRAHPGGTPVAVHAVWLAGGGEGLGAQLTSVTATLDEIGRAQSGDGAIVLMGVLHYTDIFDRQRETGFAYYMEGTPFRPDGGGGGSGGTVNLQEVPNPHLNYSR